MQVSPDCPAWRVCDKGWRSFRLLIEIILFSAGTAPVLPDDLTNRVAPLLFWETFFPAFHLSTSRANGQT